MKKMNQKSISPRDQLFLWLPVILWATVIFSFSAYPTGIATEIDWQDFVVKKTAHIVEYGVLAVLIFRAFKENGVSKNRAGYLALLFCLLYGFSDELHQSTTPGRDPRIRDVFIDAIGASLGVYVLINILPKTPLKIRLLAAKLRLL